MQEKQNTKSTKANQNKQKSTNSFILLQKALSLYRVYETKSGCQDPSKIKSQIQFQKHFYLFDCEKCINQVRNVQTWFPITPYH